jgi:hypothetical protein
LIKPGSKLSKLRQLNRRQWQVLLASEFILPMAELRLRTGGFRKAMAWAASPLASETGLSPDNELKLAKETAFALAVGANHGLWKPRCLTRSLALGWFLRRRGIPFEIRVGVPSAKGFLDSGEAPDFTAHAWVETQGLVLNDRDDVASEFSPFDAGSGPA